MSQLRSFKRHLKQSKVWLANQVAEEKIKIARQVVLERAKKDAAFASDVLKAVGDALPKELKEACEESVSREKVPVTTEKALALADEISDLTPVPQIDLDKEANRVILETCAESKKLHEPTLVEADKRADELWKPTSDEVGGPIVGGDLTYQMVPVQTDGGGEILVHETELLDYPRDGDEPPLDITEKLVQMDGPKPEKTTAEPNLPVFEAFDKYPKDSKVKGW